MVTASTPFYHFSAGDVAALTPAAKQQVSVRHQLCSRFEGKKAPLPGRRAPYLEGVFENPPLTQLNWTIDAHNNSKTEIRIQSSLVPE